MKPTDGFWIRFSGIFGGTDVQVRKGYAKSFRGQNDPEVQRLPFGRMWASSDAQVVTWWSRRSGLTCKHYEGLSFWLGRGHGYRIYYDAPGFRPNVRPLFRTGHGVWCGISLDNLEPANPVLECWRAADGLVLTIAHDDAGEGGAHARREKAEGYRPGGFPVLRRGERFVWRCRKVDPSFADSCSPNTGQPVFTCFYEGRLLTCRNRRSRGFWATSRSFYTF